jgi:FkbM family methyltransferase
VVMLRSSGAFAEPRQVWSAYFHQKQPNGNQIKLKNGHTIHLSNSNLDISTVMVIFTRKEYGEIPKGGTIIDVGANIGVFSMYAAFHGAKRIYAFEPNKESFETLLMNIRENGLEDIIIPINKAVSEKDGDYLLIPKASSPYNKSFSNTADKSEEMDRIETISLPTFIKQNNIEKIDLLKMDCEGAEFGIIPNMPSETWSKIDKYKLEFHNLKRKKEITDILTKYGFRNTLFKNMILWFEK